MRFSGSAESTEEAAGGVVERRMRVGIDVRTMVWNRVGGLATYTTNLVEGLTRIDPGLDLVRFSPIPALAGSPGDLAVIPSMVPIHAFHLPTGPTRAQVEAEAADLAGEIRARSLALYHIPHNGMGMPAAIDCPIVITLFDVAPLALPEGVHPRYVEYFREQGPIIAERADLILTASEFSRGEICRMLAVDPEKIRVVPLAVAEIFRPSNPERSSAAVSRSYGLTGDYILYVGGLNKRKNLITLFESFAIASDSIPRGTKLAVVGNTSWMPPEVPRAIRQLDLDRRVVFLGKPSTGDLPDLYRAARLFVYVSLYEGFGLPPLEAMACGVPTIVSDSTSLPEVVGDGAMLVDPRDPAGIAECMQLLLHDKELRRSLIHRGLERRRSFSWERTAQLTGEVYRDLAARRPMS
jgi:glycosyltransferase involved in cell wall biosynthesis